MNARLLILVPVLWLPAGRSCAQETSGVDEQNVQESAFKAAEIARKTEAGAEIERIIGILLAENNGLIEELKKMPSKPYAAMTSVEQDALLKMGRRVDDRIELLRQYYDLRKASAAGGPYACGEGEEGSEPINPKVHPELFKPRRELKDFIENHGDLPDDSSWTDVERYLCVELKDAAEAAAPSEAAQAGVEEAPVNAPPKAACYNNDPELLKQAEAIGLESKEAITYCDLPALIRAKNDPVRRKVQERYDY